MGLMAGKAKDSKAGDRQDRRRRAERHGHVSEYVAAFLLLIKGYRILALRYRTRAGEIDLVARKRDLVVFVEVKARASQGAALDAVSYEAQRRIRTASEIWLSRRRDAHLLSFRYDVVVIVPGRFPRHFRDAF
jgi:putative endonuclease